MACAELCWLGRLVLQIRSSIRNTRCSSRSCTSIPPCAEPEILDRGPGDRNAVACTFSPVRRYLMDVWLSGAGPLKKVSGDCDASRAQQGNYLLWAPLCKVQSRVLGDTKLLSPRGGHLVGEEEGRGGGDAWERLGGTEGGSRGKSWLDTKITRSRVYFTSSTGAKLLPRTASRSAAF